MFDNFMGTVKRHPGFVIGGVIGLVVLIYLFTRSSGSQQMGVVSVGPSDATVNANAAITAAQIAQQANANTNMTAVQLAQIGAEAQDKANQIANQNSVALATIGAGAAVAINDTNAATAAHINDTNAGAAMHINDTNAQTAEAINAQNTGVVNHANDLWFEIQKLLIAAGKTTQQPPANDTPSPTTPAGGNSVYNYDGTYIGPAYQGNEPGGTWNGAQVGGSWNGLNNILLRFGWHYDQAGNFVLNKPSETASGN